MEIKKINVFDYVIAILNRSKNEKFGSIISKYSKRKDTGVYTLYTKGIIQGKELKSQTDTITKISGSFSLDLNDIVPGRYVFEVIEDSEQWCLDKKLNDKMPSSVESFQINEASNFFIGPNKKIIICLGTGKYGDILLEPGVHFITNDNNIIWAESIMLGMIIID